MQGCLCAPLHSGEGLGGGVPWHCAVPGTYPSLSPKKTHPGGGLGLHSDSRAGEGAALLRSHHSRRNLTHGSCDAVRSALATAALRGSCGQGARHTSKSCPCSPVRGVTGGRWSTP
jgi:hypothetical protein